MSDTNESSGKWCLVFILQQQSFYFNFSNLQLTLPPSPLAIIITIIVQQFLFCFVSSDEAWPRHKWFSNDFIRSKKIYFSEVGHFNHKDWRKYNLKPCYLQNWTCLWSSIIFKIISLLLSSESWYLRLKPRVVLREWNYQLRPETPGWWSELGVDCLFDGYLRLDNVRLSRERIQWETRRLSLWWTGQLTSCDIIITNHHHHLDDHCWDNNKHWLHALPH